MAANGQGLLQGWNSLLVRPEPLLIKDIKVQVNKQKPNSDCPAQMKHSSDGHCSNVQPALQQTQSYAVNSQILRIVRMLFHNSFYISDDLGYA